MPNSADQIVPLIEGLRASGLSEVEIARRSGVARSVLRDIQTGMTRSPSYTTYMRIASTYERHVGPVPPLKLR
jgi:transcriptional regulator with XRE-family HTH domain